jgi:hypothetical protein
MRSIQPLRMLAVGAPRSISVAATACERLTTSWPTACTTASFSLSHKRYSGFIAGCRPKVSSTFLASDAGVPMVGRSSAYRVSPIGATAERPSKPPRRDTTTSVSALVAEAGAP